MIAGRAMYIWNLQSALNERTVAAIVNQAQLAKLSSLWVKIGDGTAPYDNIQGNSAATLTELVGSCAVSNIAVLGYHVPHCPTPQAAQEEISFVAGTVQQFGLAGVVVDNEDGSGYFQGNSQCASTYAQALHAAMNAAKKLVVMSSDDIISAHPDAYATVIGAFVDINAPQVYYGQSPSVQNRLDWAISENSGIAAPFFPVGAAFLSDPAAGEGGFSDPDTCAKWAGQFIDLISQLNRSDPNKYPGYAFWEWSAAPAQFWDVLNSTNVFTTPRVAALFPKALPTSARAAPLALGEILQAFDKRADCIPVTGVTTPDLNLPGNILLVVDRSEFYSFRIADIVDQEDLGNQRSRVWIKKGTRAWQSSAIAIGGTLPMRETLVGMEDVPEPPTVELPGGPVKATEFHKQSLRRLQQVNTIAAAAAAYTGSCIGGDHYRNNCAHFLSDAFIRVGFSDLIAGQSADHFITARCDTTAKRPIRARDMWQWFQSKATQTSSAIQQNTGTWSVFQLDEQVYWGGHVLIIDTDAWAWYGTGNHPDWQQYAYKW